MAGGLTAKQDSAAGDEHALELGERELEVRNVVEHGVAEHQVEALIAEREALGVDADRLDVKPRRWALSWSVAEHAGRDIAAGRLFDDAGTEHVPA